MNSNQADRKRTAESSTGLSRVTRPRNDDSGFLPYGRRRFLRAAGSVAVAGLLAGCTSAGSEGNASDGGSESVDGTLVEMTGDFLFDPETVEISTGETIVWRTEGFTPHTVTAYQDRIPDEAEYFASGGFTTEQAARDGYPEGEIGVGGEYEHTFDIPGTYEYFCVPHESMMKGTVVVRSSADSTSRSAFNPEMVR